MGKVVENTLKCLLVPCHNIWGNIALLLSDRVDVGDQVVLLPAENDKQHLIALNSIFPSVGNQVIVFPVQADKDNLVCHRSPGFLFISGYVRDWDSKPIENEWVDLICSLNRELVAGVIYEGDTIVTMPAGGLIKSLSAGDMIFLNDVSRGTFINYVEAVLSSTEILLHTPSPYDLFGTSGDKIHKAADCATQLTKSTGYYKFWVFSNHDYAIRLRHHSCFSPEYYSYRLPIQASKEHQSFYEIAVLGHVYHSDLTPFPGISIEVAGTTKVGSADGNGFYVIERVDRGDCIVKPIFSNVFLPEQYNLTPISVKQTGKDFIERCGYSIQGHVYEKDGVTPIHDHEIFAFSYTYNGGEIPIPDRQGSTMTNGGGEYILDHMDDYGGLCIDENYEIYPAKRWFFYPEKYTYEPLGGFKINQNFVKGTTFYQKYKSGSCNRCWGNYWPGGGSFPIPGEDYVQKVRFGAVVKVDEASENPLIRFRGLIHPTAETLWDTGNISAGEEVHAEAFYDDYEPWMTPNGFFVRQDVGNDWHYEIAIWSACFEIQFLYGEDETLPPSVETIFPTEVTDTSARLNGSLTSVGWDECFVFFQWGIDKNSYDHETTPESFSMGCAYFHADISDLIPHMSYWFRAAVTSGGVTYYGDDKWFTNPPYPPLG